MADLKKRTVRSRAQPFVQRLAAEGISANKALKILQEQGLGYRRSDFLADYRKYRNKEKVKNVAKYIRNDKFPTEAVAIDSPLNFKRKYNHLIEYEFINLDTGKKDRKNMYVTDDVLNTVGTIKGQALNALSEKADRSRLRILKVNYMGFVKGAIY